MLLLLGCFQRLKTTKIKNVVGYVSYFEGFHILLPHTPKPTPKLPKIRNVGGYVSHFGGFPDPKTPQNKKSRGLRFLF